MPGTASVGGVSVSVNLDDKDAMRQLGKLRQKIEDTQKALNEKRTQRDSVAAEMEKAEIAAEKARAKVKQLQAELANAAPGARAGIRAQLTEANADLRAQISNMDKLNAQWQKLDGDITAGESNLERMTEQAAGLERQVAAGSGTMAKLQTATAAAAKKFEKTFNRLGAMVRRVFLFSLITRGLRMLREYLGDLLMSTPEFSAALGDLKSALLTLVQPLISVAVPAFIQFLQVVTQVVTALAAIVSRLFGTTFEASQEAAQGLYEQAQAYKETGSAAKKAAGQLAAFDELNVLHEDSSGGGGSASGGATPQFDLSMDLTETELDNILQIVEKIGAVLLGWKIGTELGLGLSGILGLVATIYATMEGLKAYLEAWDSGITWDNLMKLLGALAVAAAGAALAFGPLGAGIALVVGGIALLVLGIRDIIKNGPNVKNVLTVIAGAVAVAVGAFLLFRNIPGLITGTIPGTQGALGKLAKAVKIAALAVFDAIMIAYDVQALKKASDTYLAAQETHNRETETALSTYAKLYKDKGKEAADEWAKMVYNIDTTNASFDQAQELIAAKIEGYWADVPQNMWDGFRHGWDYYFGEDGKGLWQLFKDAFTNVITWLKDLLGIHSPSKVFEEIGDDVGEGFLEGFQGAWERITAWLTGGIERFVNGIISGLNWLISQMNKIALDVPDWVPVVGGQSWGVSIAQIPEWHAPALASGAVIPPNREFMAVLGDQKSGTNIEAPLQTMVDAFRQALNEGGYGDAVVNLYLDGEKIASNTVKHINRANRAGGRLSIV